MLALFSCSKEELVEPKQEFALPQQAKMAAFTYPQVKDSRLYFENFDAFEQFMAAFSEKQPYHLEEQHQQSGFISMSQVLDMEDFSALPTDYNNDTTTHVEDPYLLEVLNYNQEVAIGELICRVEADFVYIYLDGHFDEVANFKSGGQGDRMNLNEVKLINDKLIAFKLEIDRSSENRFWVAGYGSKTYESIRTLGSRNRLVACHWQTNLLFHQSAGMRTIHKERRKGKWRKRKADRVRCSGHVDVDVNHNNSGWVTMSYPFSIDRLNKKQVAHAIFSLTGINVKVSGGSIKNIAAPAKSKFKISNTTVSHHRLEEAGGAVNRPNMYWSW